MRPSGGGFFGSVPCDTRATGERHEVSRVVRELRHQGRHGYTVGSSARGRIIAPPPTRAPAAPGRHSRMQPPGKCSLHPIRPTGGGAATRASANSTPAGPACRCALSFFLQPYKFETFSPLGPRTPLASAPRAHSTSGARTRHAPARFASLLSPVPSFAPVIAWAHLARPPGARGLNGHLRTKRVVRSPCRRPATGIRYAVRPAWVSSGLANGQVRPCA